MSSLLEELVRAIERSQNGGEMVIERIQKADNIIRGEKCPWCGANLRTWAEELGEEHAKDAVCNWKEKEVIDLLHEFGCNYQPENPSISDTSIQVRHFATRIARIVLRKP